MRKVSLQALTFFFSKLLTKIKKLLKIYNGQGSHTLKGCVSMGQVWWSIGLCLLC